MYVTALKEKRTIEANWKKWKTRLLEWRTHAEISQRSCFEEIIKEYNLESGKYALEAEQKENLELFKLSNGLRCAVCYWRKAMWTGQYHWKKEKTHSFIFLLLYLCLMAPLNKIWCFYSLH